MFVCGLDTKHRLVPEYTGIEALHTCSGVSGGSDSKEAANKQSSTKLRRRAMRSQLKRNSPEISHDTARGASRRADSCAINTPHNPVGLAMHNFQGIPLSHQAELAMNRPIRTVLAPEEFR